MINLEDKYLKENIIAYIGNKRRLLNFLHSSFSSIIESDKSVKTALDLFAGSGSVSRLLKAMDLKVHSNDLEYYSYILNFAHININEEDTKKMFLHTGGIDNTIEMLNSISSIKDKDRYISTYYAPKDDNNVDTVNERLFYTQYNARKIDILRHSIEDLYKNKAINKNEYYYLLASLIYQAATKSNTSGVFKAFHNGFGGRNKDALNRILSPISLNKLSLSNNIKGTVSRGDANKFVMNSHEYDLVYLDPPYNQHQYGSNYHLLNTIALWDKPYVNKEIYINGKKTDKSAIRKDWVNTKSNYCYKQTASTSLDSLMKNLNAKYIVLSYSTDGIINYNDLLDILHSKGQLNIVSSEYTRYRGAKRSEVNTTKNIEYLFVVNCKKKHKKQDKEYSIKKHYIDNINLMCKEPLDVGLGVLNIRHKDIDIKLDYSLHVNNILDIEKKLYSKDIDFIKSFSLFISSKIKKDAKEKISLYINHFENVLNTKAYSTKDINYYLTHILICYQSYSNMEITERIKNILLKITITSSTIKKLRSRLEYNNRYSI